MNQQNQALPPFNPDSVVINIPVNYKQCNLLLEALGKLTFDRVEGLYNHVRTTGVTAMQAAEREHEAQVHAAINDAAAHALTQHATGAAVVEGSGQ